MNKTSDIGDRMHNAGESIKDWYSNINPELKHAIIRGLAGAAGGAVLGGGAAALYGGSGDPEVKKNVVGPALLGALLGGGAAAGIPAGMKMLSGKVKMPGEKGKGTANTVADTIVGGAVRHPFAVGLPAAAALTAGPAYSLHRTAMELLPERVKQLSTALAETNDPLAQKDIQAQLDKLISGGEPKFTGPFNLWSEAAKQGVRTIKKVKGKEVVSGKLSPAYFKDLEWPDALAKARGKALMIPAGLGLGYLVDKYIRGEW